MLVLLLANSGENDYFVEKTEKETIAMLPFRAESDIKPLSNHWISLSGVMLLLLLLFG